MQANASFRYFAGLDVHRDIIVMCTTSDAIVSDAIVSVTARSANDAGRLPRFIGHVRVPFGEPRCCYEASSCGYILYHLLQALNVDCQALFPALSPLYRAL